MATYLLVESVLRMKDGRQLGDVKSAQDAIDWGAKYLLATNGRARAEVGLWARMIVKCVIKIGAIGLPEGVPQLEIGGLQHLPSAKLMTIDGARDAAAALFIKALDGSAEDATHDVDTVWPGALEEPLATWFLTAMYASRRRMPHAAAVWDSARERSDSIMTAWTTRGEDHGSWAPVGEFGAEFGRAGTTAACWLLVLTREGRCVLVMSGE